MAEDRTDLTLKRILDDYDKQKTTFEDCKSKVIFIIKEILKIGNTTVHDISGRVKERKKLKDKIKKKENKYKSLAEITDVVGFRIITHYSDDVDKVAAIIEKEFKIDPDNSIDKRIFSDPRSFGYVSLHYVAELDKKRKLIPEYTVIKNLKFEIQIRSILQHSWAEIEHDLGYKSSIEVPRHLLRGFSRVSGLLELADTEFSRIRKELADYKQNHEKIASSEADINKDSLSYFIMHDLELNVLEEKISRKLDRVRGEIGSLSAQLIFCKFYGITKIGELSKLYKANLGKIEPFLVKNMTDHAGKELMKGISIFYLPYAIYLDSRDDENLKKYIGQLRPGEKDEFLDEIVNDFKKKYDMVRPVVTAKATKKKKSTKSENA